MARNSRRSPGQRDAPVIANDPVADLIGPQRSEQDASSPITDRRSFHPDPDRFEQYPGSGAPARIKLRDRPSKRSPSSYGGKKSIQNFSQTKAVLAFANPELVPACVKRRRRKEVLFALKRTKKGSAKRHRKHTWRSMFKC